MSILTGTVALEVALLVAGAIGIVELGMGSGAGKGKAYVAPSGEGADEAGADMVGEGR